MADTVRYEELHPEEFRERLAAAPVAYVPLGTVEWHGEHMPYGTDTYQARGFLERLARRIGGVVHPGLTLGPDQSEVRDGERLYGVETNASINGGEPRKLDGNAFWVADDVFTGLVEATLRNLARAGFRVVVLHGHTPSTQHVQEHAADWEAEFDLEIHTCWREDESDGLGIMTDHAAANETSLMLAMEPDRVEMDRLPADPEDWPRGVAGDDPREHASAERGERAIELQLDRMEEVVTAALERAKSE